ncbi:P2X purinoceptor 7-like [Saccostrea echinata]|uniref:P2X purinoceptor 7-like n=1 Tax=Saccostrea echinata TaxID=191078 RepID=UPI002A7FFFCB|nr:P2X purinoceptor 7-like [Saccostrea echinata]
MAERAVSVENYVESEVSEDELSLDLSCGSSSFDEDIETDPNSIAPFRFEPCTCGNCIVMPTAAECVCCQEVDRVHALVEESENAINCITSHPGFHPACLNLYVLQIAYYQYRQQYNESIPDSSEYTAYRQLARWAWGYLGKKVRVVLPSCAVTCIRNTFPSESGHYTGFKPG